MKRLTKAQLRVLRCLAKDDNPNFATYRIYRDHYPIVKKLVWNLRERTGTWMQVS